MKQLLRTLLLYTLPLPAALLPAAPATAQAGAALRPPAVPLVTHDPYFSIWSCADKLAADATRHWTRARQSLNGLVRIDGHTFRVMGDEPKDVPVLPQVRLQVLPTRTIYDFDGAHVHLTLTFTTPALPDDLDVLSRPVTYLTWTAHATDGREHDMAVLFSASGELVVNKPGQRVEWSAARLRPLTVLRIGSVDQPVLQKKGDDLRIDWGYLYVAGPWGRRSAALDSQKACLADFVKTGKIGGDEFDNKPREAKRELPVAALVLDMGKVAKAPVSRFLMLAYDDEYSINYFGRKLRPYWRRHGQDAHGLLLAAALDYATLQKRCRRFDDDVMADLTRVGGEKYARLAALCYRECIAACKVAADANGMPLLFPKENFSNGCIATVDVIYPMDPLFLLFSPTLAKASLVPVLNYAASSRWKFPFAPHDLGTYPLATGQVYGGGERTEENQMPVEESGNMLLLLAAIAKHDGNAKFADPFWRHVTRWAAYLEAKGFDPEKQLCTDDFAGHLAHNVNLSVKAIEALGAYGLLCELRGDKVAAARYHRLAEGLAKKWMKEADDGDHYRLAFDRPGTWSQKYNLVWDGILDLHLFPPEVARKEIAFYRKHLDRYGLPLDNRQPYTKLDWEVWTATLADSRQAFEELVAPVCRFADESPSRVPLTDWYWTKKGTQRGFQARSVVGGVFIKMLADPALWKKWAGRAKPPAGDWAPLPKPPQVRTVVPAARHEAVTWRYTFDKPGDGWPRPDFDAAGWKEGPAGFGTAGTPGSVVRTEWKTDDIWIRREFTLPWTAFADLQLLVHHDEDVEIYLNGVLAARAPGYITAYEVLPMSRAARAALKQGRNVLAAHCHQTTGGQYIDVGIVDVIDQAARAGK
jgi:hypothetical protein